MSFDIKYNRDGSVISPAPVQEVTQEQESQTEQEVVEQEQTEQPTDIPQEVPQAAQQSSSKEQNLRILRERIEKMEHERNEYARLLKEAQSNRAEESDISIGDDDLAEGKHLKKIQQEVKRLKQEAEQYKQQTTLTQTEIKLKSQYPDFDKVVSSDNIEMLRITYPELATSINATPDLYAKAVSAYTMIKQLGIHKEDVFSSDKERVLRNAAKPKPLAAVSPQKGDSPLSHANVFASGLTDDLRKQLIKEMNESRRGY